MAHKRHSLTWVSFQTNRRDGNLNMLRPTSAVRLAAVVAFRHHHTCLVFLRRLGFKCLPRNRLYCQVIYVILLQPHLTPDVTIWDDCRRSFALDDLIYWHLIHNTRNYK
jgi:hypothetical protein